MASERKKYRILVVDDDEVVASMLGQMLRRMGYSSIVCNKSTDALTLFSRVPQRFDAVIVDQMMPDVMGSLLITQLHLIRDAIPAILMTGHGDKISLQEIRESGARATLIKPVMKEWLRDVLDRVLKPAKPEL